MTREEAIQIIKNLPIYRMEQEYDRKSDLMKALKMAVESLATDIYVGSKWIPCSERLPNDTAIHEVTAQFSNGTIYTEFAYYDESIEEWWKFDDDGIVNVIAWKEHSEPYKEGEI